MSATTTQTLAARTSTPSTCPACGAAPLRAFHEVRGVPAHSVLLMPTRVQALEYPRGDIVLGCCEVCGFISNTAFDPRLNEYDGAYEATQSYSSTFNAFHKRLATQLIQRYDLHNKTVVEIGCGQGEFLQLFSELGGCRGIGFDPAYMHMPGRPNWADNERVTIIQDYYSERYADVGGDLICCKMTLEHISSVRDFITTVRRAIGERSNTTVFFQVPNALYVLRDIAFWDIYYEHCSYFTPGTLARLFRACDFAVNELWCDYDDQYVMIEARPGVEHGQQALASEEPVTEVLQAVQQFTEAYARMLSHWRAVCAQIRRDSQRVVIWGGGSKGVTFFNTLGIVEEIPYAVDINPYKHGTFLAGTGQEVVGPAFLQSYRPDLVIVMNPLYTHEIRTELDRLGVAAEILALG